RKHSTNWAYVTLVTKYTLDHPGYARAPRVALQYGSGVPGKLDATFAHETAHVFGASDEYVKRDTVVNAGYYQVKNLNSVNATNHPAECLMYENSWELCPWSRGQLGWLFFDVIQPFVCDDKVWFFGQDRSIGHAMIQRVYLSG